MKDNKQAVLAPWRALLEAHSAVVGMLSAEMEAETGLPLGWYEVLLYLQEAPTGRLRMHELADSLLSSRSAVTRYVDRMESAGLVERIVCEADRRGFELAMTPAGHEQFRRAGRIHLRGIRQHFAAHLSDEEAAVLMAALDRVAIATRSAHQDPGAA